jgi:hypothetical protein
MNDEAGETSIEQLEAQLRLVSRELNQAAKLIRDNNLNASANIRRIAVALGEITDIMLQIYQVRPDLTPDQMRPEWGKRGNQPRDEVDN